MILLVNEFGRAWQQAGLQEGLPSKATAPWVFVVIARKFCPCLALVIGLFTHVFLFCSKFIEGFAGRAPSAITFKAAI